MKLLLLTDSRGAHKAAGSTHKLYAERLAVAKGIQITALRHTHKWTTLVDLLELLDTQFEASDYDYVIIHAGIVDHSPRPASMVFDGIMDPADVTPAGQVADMIRRRDFSTRKIINAKRKLFEKYFGASRMTQHLETRFATQYNGEPTMNLYSREMSRESIIPRLQAIPNLIFVGSNNFVPGWDGDYPKQRPENIRIIEDYSRDICEALPRVVNLHQWSPEQVKAFTTDNLHLTQMGSDWINARLLEYTGHRKRDYMIAGKSVGLGPAKNPWPLKVEGDPEDISSIRLRGASPMTPEREVFLRDYYGIKEKHVATLVIGVRLQGGDTFRLRNTESLIAYLKSTYGNLFDILVVEQDKAPNPELQSIIKGDVRYKFLYNPAAYNRGWLYNVAARHFTTNKVMGLLDTDILPGENFLQCVLDCRTEFDVISPNRCLFYATEEQTQLFRRLGKFDGMPVTEDALKNPTTFGGGMVVANRDAYLRIGGFEQYIGYGCEDRAFDVTLLSLLPAHRVRMDSEAYFHQYHPIVPSERIYFKDIYAHLVENFGCEYRPGLKSTDYIHTNCRHADIGSVAAAAERRKESFGDPDLYRKHTHLTMNGAPGSVRETGPVARMPADEKLTDALFNGKDPYDDRELLTGKFAGAWAPSVKPAEAVDDTANLQFFYNRFKGKRCFIIGNGPSLNKIDLSKLENEYTFAVNSIYYKTRETGFMPTFFVVEDNSVMKENIAEIREFDAPFKFFPGIYQSLHPKQPGTYFFKLNRGFYEKHSPNLGIPRFSTDASRVLYCGQSVTYINLQLAFYMGFTDVYLVGMDFSYVIPESHKRTGDVLLSDTDDPNHFHKDYFGVGKTWKDPKLDRVLQNYKMAKLVYEAAGRRILNATVGGELEEFERVNYDGLFGGLDKSFSATTVDLSRPEGGQWMRKPSQNVRLRSAPVAAEPRQAESVAAILTAPVAPASPAPQTLGDMPLVEELRRRLFEMQARMTDPSTLPAAAPLATDVAMPRLRITDRSAPTPLTFGGGNAMRLSLSAPLIGQYAVAARFQTFYTGVENYGTSPTSPPMPFVIGTLACYIKRPGVAEFRVGSGQTQAVGVVELHDDWCEVFATIERQGSEVWANGQRILVGPRVPPAGFANVSLGTGYHQRDWSGRFDYVAVRRGPTPIARALREADVRDDAETVFYFNGQRVLKLG